MWLAWIIFKKDVRRLWWEIAVTLAVLGSLVRMDAARARQEVTGGGCSHAAASPKLPRPALFVRPTNGIPDRRDELVDLGERVLTTAADQEVLFNLGSFGFSQAAQ